MDIRGFLAGRDYRFFRVLCFLLAAWMLYQLFTFDWSNFNYLSFRLSDWMINYEGGFVRRGLIGQLLLELYDLHPYSIRNVVAAICILSFIVLQWLLIRLFRKEGWSYTLLFAPFMVYRVMTCFNMGQFAMRRDFLVLLLMWGIFFLYSRYKERRSGAYFFTFQMMSVLILLIYEPSFFFTFPILLANYYMYLCGQGRPKMLSVFRTLLFFSPAILTMAVLCLFNGNEHAATLIWESWLPCMERYPTSSGTEMGEGVAFLMKSTSEAMKLHLTTSFTGSFLLSHKVPSLPFTLANIVFVYYLVIRLNTINLKWNEIKDYDIHSMSSIMLIQFVSLIPMFTVLSCDWGRNYPYWVVSTLVAYHYFKNDDMRILPVIGKMSNVMQNFIDRFSLLKNPWVYFAIFVTLPIPYCFRATLYDSIPMLIFVQLKELICNLLL